MKRILIANIFGIGDVLFTTPVITNLKEAFGGVSIDYLCNGRTKDILKCNTDVDEVFVYEKDDYLRLWRESRTAAVKKVIELWRSLRGRRYDMVFDFTLSRRFGFLFALAGIPRRVGLDYKRRGIFLTDKIKLTGFEKKHVVEYYLDLLEKLDIPVTQRGMSLAASPEAIEWALGAIGGKGISAGTLVAVIPGGGASWGPQAFRKHWPARKFAGVADILSGYGYPVAVLGSDAETELCGVMADAMRTKPVIAENGLTLERYIALLSVCGLVLCNDGGPLHMAAALGVKTVSIFGPVAPEVYGPYPASDGNRVMTAPDLPCRPCYHKFR
ncbi:MAG: glycosyltransferase family 9 protein, partial [Candidatus Omnitrophota bacterium]